MRENVLNDLHSSVRSETMREGDEERMKRNREAGTPSGPVTRNTLSYRKNIARGDAHTYQRKRPEEKLIIFVCNIDVVAIPNF